MLKWLRKRSEITAGSLNNLGQGIRMHFRNKRGYLKGKINEFLTVSKAKNIGDMYRGINEREFD
jgi:hypothetical protein